MLTRKAPPSKRRNKYNPNTGVKEGSVSVPPVPPHDQQRRMAEAVHHAVSEVTQSDGLGKCLPYAVTGYGLIYHVLGVHPVLQGGRLQILADPPDGWIEMNPEHNGFHRGEYHAWLAIPPVRMPGLHHTEDGTCQIIDFSARHFQRFCEETISLTPGDPAQVRWTRTDTPPLWVWQTKPNPDHALYMPDEVTTNQMTHVLTGSPRDDIRAMIALAIRHYEEVA